MDGSTSKSPFRLGSPATGGYGTNGTDLNALLLGMALSSPASPQPETPASSYGDQVLEAFNTATDDSAYPYLADPVFAGAVWRLLRDRGERLGSSMGPPDLVVREAYDSVARDYELGGRTPFPNTARPRPDSDAASKPASTSLGGIEVGSSFTPDDDWEAGKDGGFFHRNQNVGGEDGNLSVIVCGNNVVRRVDFEVTFLAQGESLPDGFLPSTLVRPSIDPMWDARVLYEATKTQLLNRGWTPTMEGTSDLYSGLCPDQFCTVSMYQEARGTLPSRLLTFACFPTWPESLGFAACVVVVSTASTDTIDCGDGL